MRVNLRQTCVFKNLNKQKGLTTVTGQILFLIVITLVFSTVMTNWMKGIAGDKIILEQLEIETVWVKPISTNPNGWEINMIVKNSGTVRNNIEYLAINGKKIETYETPGTGIIEGKTTSNVPITGESFETGQSKVIQIWISKKYESLSSGTSVEIKLKGIGATEYFKLIKLT